MLLTARYLWCFHVVQSTCNQSAVFKKSLNNYVVRGISGRKKKITKRSERQVNVLYSAEIVLLTNYGRLPGGSVTGHESLVFSSHQC